MFPGVLWSTRLSARAWRACVTKPFIRSTAVTPDRMGPSWSGTACLCIGLEVCRPTVCQEATTAYWSWQTVQKMEGGPFGARDRNLASNHHKLRALRALVGSVA
jgi:hypothetical protein